MTLLAASKDSLFTYVTRSITSVVRYGSISSRLISVIVITFHVSRRPREMYCGHAHLCVCLSVCLSAAACPYYCMDPDVTCNLGEW